MFSVVVVDRCERWVRAGGGIGLVPGATERIEVKFGGRGA